MEGISTEKTRENARPRNEEEEKVVKEFHDALHGGLIRDTLYNSGVPFTGEVLAESERRSDALLDDPEYVSLLMKL